MQNHWRRCYGGVSSRRCVIPTTLLDRLLFLTEPVSAGCGVYDSDDDRHNQTKRGVLLLGKATTFGNKNNILTYNQRAGAPRETVEREAATRSSPD